MKILQITDDLPPAVLGGSGRIAWETSVGLQRLGHDVHILTIGTRSDVSEREGIHIHVLPPSPRRFAHYRSVFSKKREREIMRLIENMKPDIIHAHGIAWHIGYRWIKPAAARGIPCFYTAHGVMTAAYGKVLEDRPHRLWDELRRARWEYNPLRNVLIKRALGHCNAIICVSDALKNFLTTTGLKNLTTIRNGIDLAFWREQTTRSEARQMLGLPVEKTIFLFAGRLGHDKGSSALDVALPEDAHLIVAGDVHAGLFKRIGSQVIGFPQQSTEQMRLLYAACDAVVVPSIYLDPFPTVCLEAMACARAVVATCFGGAKEAVQDGVTGWIINPCDESALRERLQWCIDHPEECSRAGEAGRRRMEEYFSLDTYITKLLQLYRTNKP